VTAPAAAPATKTAPPAQQKDDGKSHTAAPVPDPVESEEADNDFVRDPAIAARAGATPSGVQGAGSPPKSAQPVASTPVEGPVSTPSHNAMFADSDDDEIDSEVGRTLKFDDASDTPPEAPADEGTSEFITDPMGSHAPQPDPPPPPPKQTPRPPAEVEALEITVPVAITRSQVRKKVPLRLLLEIQVVDD
jgi:hypothetical protein